MDQTATVSYGAPQALKTVLTLIERGGEVVSKKVLIEAVWPDSYVEEGNLTQNIFLLRAEQKGAERI